MSAGNGRTMLTGNKLISEQEIDEVTEFIIETGSKLGEVFTKLPAGIINKTETGIGATTLEIESNRNSIIVEPVKITASSKAKKHGALYVGSATKIHPGRITDKAILSYLDNKSISPKKIIVVADSLSRVINCIGKDKLQDFFLMIDEADSFQLDSSYRESMERVMDIYKTFSKENRCLVTATMLDFSDPELQNEKKTRVKYETPTKRKISVVYSDQIIGSTVDVISSLLKSQPGQKIMVAYNHVRGCYDIAQHLTRNNVINSNEIKILCSTGSKEDAGIFYTDLDSTQLPGIVNFVTSAFFSGYDIDERFHLISVSEGTIPIFILSENRLKQIAGRSRLALGLYSETILYKVFESGTDQQDYSEQDLIDAATLEMKALECVESHFSSNKILQDQALKIRDLITKHTTVDRFQFLRKDFKGKYIISYLNIDAFLETQRVKRELYKNREQLPEVLAGEGNQVSSHNTYSKTKVQKNDNTEARTLKVDSVIKELKKLTSEEDIETFKLQKHWNSFQKNLIDIFLNFKNQINPIQLLDFLDEVGKKKDSRRMKNFILSSRFTCLEESTPVKRAFNANFKKGEKFTGQELHELLNKSLAEAGQHVTITSPVKAVQIVNLLFKVKRTGDGRHRIYGENPFNIDVIKPLTGNLTFDNYFIV